MRVICSFLFGCCLVFSQDLNGISISRMIGQMILVNFSGTKSDDQWVNQLSKEASYGKIGGVIITDNNIINKEQLKKLTKRFNDIAAGHKLFVAILQNGGIGKINSLDFTKFLSPSNIAKNMNILAASEHYKEMAKSLFELGINLNLAPNITKFPFNEDNEINTIYTNEFLSAFSNQILSVLGRFPNKNKNEFNINNLKIFYDLIKREKVLAIMMDNNIIPELDDKFPAMLSKRIGDILRNRFKFNGVIFSDGLLEIDKFSLEERVVLAINSGVDIFILNSYFWQNSNSVKAVSDAILNAIKTGKISEQQVENSYKRIIKFKEKLENYKQF